MQSIQLFAGIDQSNLYLRLRIKSKKEQQSHFHKASVLIFLTRLVNHIITKMDKYSLFVNESNLLTQKKTQKLNFKAGHFKKKLLKHFKTLARKILLSSATIGKIKW